MSLSRCRAYIAIAALAFGGLLMPVEMTSGQAVTSELSSPVTVAETLVDAIIGESMPEPAFIGVIRLVVPAGVDVPGGRVSGYRIVVVERGELIVQLAAEPAADIGVARPAGTGPNEEHRLRAGDALVVPPEAEHWIRNASSEAVTSLDIVILQAPPPSITPTTTESGIVFHPLLTGDFQLVPAAPATITLERMTLPLAADTFAQPAPGPVLAYVESGEVTISASEGRVEFRRSAAPIPGSVVGPIETIGHGAHVALSAGAMVQFHQGASGSLRSIDDGNAELLILAISPGN